MAMLQRGLRFEEAHLYIIYWSYNLLVNQTPDVVMGEDRPELRGGKPQPSSG